MNKYTNRYFERGFSIIEYLIYIGLLAILLSVFITIFTSILDTQTQTDATGAVDQNARYILARLTYDMQSAQIISTPASIGQQTTNLQLVVNNINYSYDTDNFGDLQITNNNGTDNLNGYDASISAVTFKRIGNSGGKNSIQVNFTVTSRTLQRNVTKSQTYQTTIGTR